MDAHLEHHLPLITARLIFAPRALPPPPTITQRMSFGFGAINLAGREQSPMIEPKRARTPLMIRRADTARPITAPRRVEFRMPSEPLAQHDQAEYISSASDEEMDNGMAGSDDDDQLDHENNDTHNLIPKPRGDVSRPGRGGYTLYQALDWNQKTYDSVLVAVTKLAKERLDLTKSYRGQSRKKIAQLVDTARKEFSFLKDYANDWPIHDMLKTYLKNRSQNARNAKGKETVEKIDQIVNGSSAQS